MDSSPLKGEVRPEPLRPARRFTPPEGSGGDASSGRDVAQFVFKHLGSMVAVIAGVTALVVALVWVIPPTYAARGLVLVESRKSPTLRTDPVGYNLEMDEVVNSEIEIVTSRGVAEVVVDELRLAERPQKDSRVRRAFEALERFLDDSGLVVKLDRREKLIRGVQTSLKVKQPPRSGLLSITYYDEDAGHAAEMAAAVIRVYLARHRDIFSNNSAAFFQERLAETERALSTLRDAIRGETDRFNAESLELKRRSLENAYLFYKEKADRARIDAEADTSLINVRVVDTPRVPKRPQFSRLFLILVGFVASMLLAVSVAFLREYFDHAVYSPADLAAHAHVAVLGSVRRGAAPLRKRG